MYQSIMKIKRQLWAVVLRSFWTQNLDETWPVFLGRYSRGVLDWKGHVIELICKMHKSLVPDIVNVEGEVVSKYNIFLTWRKKKFTNKKKCVIYYLMLNLNPKWN